MPKPLSPIAVLAATLVAATVHAEQPAVTTTAPSTTEVAAPSASYVTTLPDWVRQRRAELGITEGTSGQASEPPVMGAGRPFAMQPPDPPKPPERPEMPAMPERTAPDLASGDAAVPPARPAAPAWVTERQRMQPPTPPTAPQRPEMPTMPARPAPGEMSGITGTPARPAMPPVPDWVTKRRDRPQPPTPPAAPQRPEMPTMPEREAPTPMAGTAPARPAAPPVPDRVTQRRGQRPTPPAAPPRPSAPRMTLEAPEPPAKPQMPADMEMPAPEYGPAGVPAYRPWGRAPYGAWGHPGYRGWGYPAAGPGGWGNRWWPRGGLNYAPRPLGPCDRARPMPVAPSEPQGPADGDSDGVADGTDLCPDTAEGVAVDALGCDNEARIVLRGVNFKTDSDQLTEASLAILDGVSATLSANPQIRVMVAGHTDSDGDDVYNRDLSQRRAQRVVDYLSESGVDRDNMIARGYGEEQPIATNETTEGKAQNRRVELNRL